MNDENLKTPSPKEARERGKKGGIASGKSRNEKRLIQSALQKALKGNYDVNGKNVGGYDALAIKMIEQALKGNVKAFVEIRDTIGEKPKELLELETNDISGIKIKFVDKSNANTGKEKDPKIVGDYTPPSNAEE